MSTINLAEAIWTAIAAVGLLLSVWGFVDAIHDLRAIDRLGVNGAMRALARQQARAESRNVAIMVIFVVIGVVAALTPPPSSQTTTALSIIIGAGLLLVEGSIVAGSLDDRLTRRRLLGEIDGPPAA